CLSDKAAHGPSEHAYSGKVERLDQLGSIGGEVAEASRLMNKGCPSGLAAANPLRTSNGRPFPKRRYAIRPPSTGIVAIGSPAIVQMSGAPTKAARRQSPSRQTADRHVDLRSLKSGPIFVQLRFHCRLDLFVE